MLRNDVNRKETANADNFTYMAGGHNTLIAKANPISIAQAAEIIKGGGLVAFPTETVYGLGANCFDESALKKIYEAKGRPRDNPLIMHLENIASLRDIAEPNDLVWRLAEMFWPGPLTIIMRKNKNVPLQATGGRDTIAVRLPSHEVARELIRVSGVPIAAPSANISSRPSPTEAAHVERDLCGRIDMILDGGSVCFGLESTIIDVTGGSAEILRPGAITREMIIHCLGTAEYINDTTARAPGTKYKHYAPLAKAVLVHTKTFKPEDIVKEINRLADAAYEGRSGVIGIMASKQTETMYDAGKYTVLSVGDRDKPETVAAGLYGTLRRFDGFGVECIFCEAYPEDGIGAAVMNRLRKACAEE